MKIKRKLKTPQFWILLAAGIWQRINETYIFSCDHITWRFLGYVIRCIICDPVILISFILYGFAIAYDIPVSKIDSGKKK